jgi:hypothetical protein
LNGAAQLRDLRLKGHMVLQWMRDVQDVAGFRRTSQMGTPLRSYPCPTIGRWVE